MNTFLVCTPVQWVADEFAGASERAGLQFEHSRGLDLPQTPPEEVAGAWMPAEHAARLLRAGYDLRWSAPGPHWLPDLPSRYTRRDISAMTRKNVRPQTGFWKVAEAKTEEFTAKWRTDEELATDIQVLHEDTWLQHTSTWLDITSENRFFISFRGDHLAISGSTYKQGEWIYYSDLDERHSAPAEQLARIVAEERRVLSPTGYALDVATLENNLQVVLEANPAWCSAVYAADIDIALMACCTSLHASPDDPFLWQPDAVLAKSAERKRLLETY